MDVTSTPASSGSSWRLAPGIGPAEIPPELRNALGLDDEKGIGAHRIVGSDGGTLDPERAHIVIEHGAVVCDSCGKGFPFPRLELTLHGTVDSSSTAILACPHCRARIRVTGIEDAAAPAGEGHWLIAAQLDRPAGASGTGWPTLQADELAVTEDGEVPEPAGRLTPATPASARLRRPIVAVVAIAVAIGAIVGLVVWAPWANKTPAGPTGLGAHVSKSNVVTLRWSQPAEKSVPDQYTILRDGVSIATVSGSSTSYSDSSLAAATVHQYEVTAVWDSRHSAPSAALSVRTLAPAPTALRARSSTTTSVTLRWSPSPGSPTPDQYTILRDGKTVATMPVATASYTDKGLVPATAYRYQVSAVWSEQRAAPWDGQRSVPSSAVKVRTLAPPLTAARLSGSFRVSIVLTSESGFTERAVGDRYTETWYFDPRCAAGACTTRLQNYDAGTIPGLWTGWTVKLARSGAHYSGTAKANLSTCMGLPVSDTVVVTLHVTRAGMVDGQWTALAWTGTYKDTAPYTSMGLQYCPSASFTASVRGS